MAFIDHADDSMELEIIESTDAVPFLRPVVNNRTGFFQQPSCSVDGALSSTTCAQSHQRTAAEEKEQPTPCLRDGDKNLFYLGLEELFRADVKAPTTLPMCAALLEQYFGIATGTFRPSQQEVCLAVLQGRHTLAVCPTGWGKSLCYQFPMLVHRLLFTNAYEQWRRNREEASDGPAQDNVPPPPMPVSRFCLVVSPLLSLMADQVEKITAGGSLKAVVMSSQTGADREERILQELTSPTCTIDVVFTSPEKLISNQGLRSVLAAQRHRLALVCVDEVHCVSKWAYDFRPSFLYVARLLDDLVRLGTSRTPAHTDRALQFYRRSDEAAEQRTTYLCLTATASQSVVADLCAAFHIDKKVICTDQARQNLHLESIDTLALASAFSGPETSVKPTPPPARVVQDALLEAVQSLPHPMIIYVQTRADADELASLIASRLGCERGPAVGTPATAGKEGGPVFGRYRTTNAVSSTDDGAGPVNQRCKQPKRRLVVRCYHAALSRAQRTSTQAQFLRDSVDVLVATVAFGMGIDKRNIRSIVHAQAPGSLEGYVQEVGRAGRDGQPSTCRVLYNPFDYFDLRSRLWSSLLSKSELREIIQAIAKSPFTRADATGSGGGDAVALVSCGSIATTLAVAEETVETILFLLLTLEPTGPLAGKRFYKGVRGSAPLGFKVVISPASQAPSATTPTATARKRSRAADHASVLQRGSGIGSLLTQLHARDPVMDALTNAGPKGIANLVDFANSVGMTMSDLQHRLDDLTASGSVVLHRRGHALLVEMGPDATEVCTDRVLDELTEWLFSVYNGRLASQVDGLCALFEVLRRPSHEGVNSMLDDTSKAQWKPPAPRLTKMEAVFIANDFVEKNRLRIGSSYDAARALLGVMPRSQITYGKFAGQLPLSHSWYVSSPHFGALREFSLEWVLRVLSAHELDTASKDTPI